MFGNIENNYHHFRCKLKRTDANSVVVLEQYTDHRQTNYEFYWIRIDSFVIVWTQLKALTDLRSLIFWNFYSKSFLPEAFYIFISYGDIDFVRAMRRILFLDRSAFARQRTTTPQELIRLRNRLISWIDYLARVKLIENHEVDIVNFFL